MLTTDAIKHFGSKAALAGAVGVKPQSVYSWGRRVPYLRQIQIERLTGGKLRAETVEQRAKREAAEGRQAVELGRQQVAWDGITERRRQMG